MEKVRISPLQFFSLLVLFQFGTTLVVNLGLQAGKDSWIAMLIGMIMGLLLFSMNAFLYSLFPDKLPTVYYRILLGKYLGDLSDCRTVCSTCIRLPEMLLTEDFW